ncbi:MAG TPA: hypothetical protein PLI14_06475 [Bacilli bacterium]|jgi:hypothetical protein|nr:hypothetical protein [Bacilli bacterium]
MNVNLIKLKEKIEEKKRTLDALRGRQEQLLEDLDKKYNIKSIQEAESFLKTLKQDIKKKEKLLEKSLDSFQKEYKDLLHD